MYQNVQATVRTPQGNTETFQSTMGVNQGCPLSPLLFGLYIDGLEQALHRSDCQPPEIEGKKISLLMFADDSKIFSSTASGLQKALDALYRFSQAHGLTVNPSKTKIICFNAKLPVSEWYLNSQKIEVVEEYRDLGLMVHASLKLSAACTPALLQSARRALYAMQARCRELGITSPKQICMMFDILVKPVLTYGCEVWGVDLILQDLNNGTKTQRDIETLQLGWTLGVCRTTPSAHVGGEFGRHPICLFILKMVVNFYERLSGWNLRVQILQAKCLCHPLSIEWGNEVCHFQTCERR